MSLLKTILCLISCIVLIATGPAISLFMQLPMPTALVLSFVLGGVGGFIGIKPLLSHLRL